MTRPEIRAATSEDVSSVVDLLRMAHAEVPFGSWCEEKVVGMVQTCLGRGAILLSCSAAGEPVATLGLQVTDAIWWSADDLMTDRWFFVHPGHRRQPHAKGLMDMAKCCARAAQVKLLIGFFSTRRAAGKRRLFEREFGEPAGCTFLWGN